MDNSGSKVLIVDDMPINRMVLASLLATNKVSSDQVESGMECLKLCRENDYDLILLDHRMPELDGVDTFVMLKEIFKEKGREVPVVCHTVENAQSNINLYKAAGFADVLIKPIDPKQLSSVLMTYLPEKDVVSTQEEELLVREETLEHEPKDMDVRDELDKLPMWLNTVPHIDLVAGVANCETAEDYVDALYIFYSSIEEKSGEIENALLNEDWTMFTLYVHSLKSIAGLVGARDLSEHAKELESASKERQINTVKNVTPTMLSEYRRFIDLLSPIKELSRTIVEEAPVPVKRHEFINDHSRTILFIRSTHCIVPTGIENNLQKADFSVITIPDEPDLIISKRFDADIILYLPSVDDESHVGITMNLLGEICQDDSKILCLTGDVFDIEAAMSTSGAYRVAQCYPRPVDITRFIQDMKQYSLLERDFHRKKSIFVVDDDTDYLAVIDRWLSDDHNVSCFSCADDILDSLMTAKPDLILLDYEMPEMDGYELMKNIRTNDYTSEIPIIFLTGKNDRDHIHRILEYKPDGYLLKTTRKDALLDAIQRFFSETLFKLSEKIC